MPCSSTLPVFFFLPRKRLAGVSTHHTLIFTHQTRITVCVGSTRQTAERGRRRVELAVP
jgi:hypothetical protein